MKTTKEELLQKIIEKQDELIKYLNDGYETEMIEEWEKFKVRKCENELTALNAQLKQSTNKSTIERKDFFESQMEKEPQLDEIIKQLSGEPIPDIHTITSTGFVEPEEFYRKPERPDRETLREVEIKITIQELGNLIREARFYSACSEDTIINDYLKSKE